MKTAFRATTAVFATAGLIALAGCAGSDGGGDADGSDVRELNLPAVEAPWLSGYQAMVEKYEEETGVTVNLTAFPFDGLLTQEANAAQSGSNAFDLFLINE